MADHDWWYFNSVAAWRDRIRKDLRLSMARYARLEGQQHPILPAHGRYIELQKRVLEILGAELEKRRESSDG